VDIKQQLTHYGKLLHDEKLVIGCGGNISARGEKGIIIKKRGICMSTASKDDYLEVDCDKIDDFSNEVSTEAPFHIACYNTKNCINAVIHVHAPYSVACGYMTDKIEKNISYEFEHTVMTDAVTIDFIEPGSNALAQEISKELNEGCNALLLKKHGSVCVGKTLEEAFLRSLALERACMVYCLTHK